MRKIILGTLHKIQRHSKSRFFVIKIFDVGGGLNHPPQGTRTVKAPFVPCVCKVWQRFKVVLAGRELESQVKPGSRYEPVMADFNNR